MKITVLGAGAVGSMIGGLLQADEPEFDVTLVGRGEHGDVMQKRKTLIVDEGQNVAQDRD